MARKLRIAVSVFFGLVTVALCVLWVRSYEVRDDIIHWNGTRFGIHFQSNYGTLSYGRAGTTSGYSAWVVGTGEPHPASQRLRITAAANSWRVYVPFWLLVVVTATVAWAPWIPRFSLRTLLIATTLVAVALGLGIWLVR